MNIFSFFTLFGGLAMFLYGMRLMSSSLKQHSSGTLKSLGIIIGANVGTTITGQIIRLLDINDSAAGWQHCNGLRNSFSGLMSMTNSVSSLSETGIFDSLFTNLDINPFFGYAVGAIQILFLILDAQ